MGKWGLAFRLMRAVPNTLTTLRLAIALAFPFVPESWRLWMVIAAAASDACDGVIARRLGAVSWTGALLDGVADKAITVIVLGTFWHEARIESWQLALLLSRDAAVALIYAWVALRRQWGAFRRVAARPLGKITTVFLFALMIAVLGVPEAVRFTLPAAMGLSVLAAVDYTLVFSRRKAAASSLRETSA